MRAFWPSTCAGLVQKSVTATLEFLTFRERSGIAQHARLELPPLLGECFGLAANLCPLDREIQYRTWFFAGLKQTQRGKHNAALQIAMKGRAKVMTHRPGKKQCTRNFDCLRYVARYSDGNRGHAARFNGSLDQSNGLMTDRSSGRQ
jgi:hypothetical protein